MSSRVRELLEEYTAKIEAELKTELLSAISGLELSPRSRALPTRARAGNGSAAAPSGKGHKRPPKELDALKDKFLGFVARNPGLRIEQINKELGTSTKQLQLPIRKLLAEKKIKASGHKRSTTYTAADGKGRRRH